MTNYALESKLQLKERSYKNIKVKPRKLLLEKCRRAKINSRLEELRKLLFVGSRNEGNLENSAGNIHMEKADILQETIRFVEISLDKEKKRSWEVSMAFMQGYMRCVQDMEVHIRSRASVVTSCDDVMQSALSRVREEAEKRKHEIQGRFSVAPVCSQITPQTPGGQGINANQQLIGQQSRKFRNTNMGKTDRKETFVGNSWSIPYSETTTSWKIPSQETKNWNKKSEMLREQLYETDNLENEFFTFTEHSAQRNEFGDVTLEKQCDDVIFDGDVSRIDQSDSEEIWRPW